MVALGNEFMVALGNEHNNITTNVNNIAHDICYIMGWQDVVDDTELIKDKHFLKQRMLNKETKGQHQGDNRIIVIVSNVSKISEAREQKHCTQKMSEVLATLQLKKKIKKWNRDLEYRFGYILVLRVTIKLFNHFRCEKPFIPYNELVMA